MASFMLWVIIMVVRWFSSTMRAERVSTFRAVLGSMVLTTMAPRQVLEAGTYAASAMGRQSAKIVVVQDAATRAQLTRMNAAVMGTDSDPMYGAPTILVVLADAHANCAVQDGSLVMGNLMLAAASLGLGSCWINRAREEFDSAEGKALLKKWGIEGDWIGVGHCILGYPAAEPKPAAPRKPDYIVRA